MVWMWYVEDPVCGGEWSGRGLDLSLLGAPPGTQSRPPPLSSPLHTFTSTPQAQRVFLKQGSQLEDVDGPKGGEPSQEAELTLLTCQESKCWFSQPSSCSWSNPFAHSGSQLGW